MSTLAAKLRLLIPRLASDADGEVLATVAAIRRVLAAEGRDLHDLAAALTQGDQELPPADLARACLASGHHWHQRELDFLNNVLRFGTAWPALSEKQAKWLRDMHQRALCAAEAA